MAVALQKLSQPQPSRFYWPKLSVKEMFEHIVYNQLTRLEKEEEFNYLKMVFLNISAK
jgi:hypothetical protein